MSYKLYSIACVVCDRLTNKKYAREHDGKCKACFTGVPRDISKDPLLCPTCRERLRTPYQKAHGYHCDFCTKQADPAGYARELVTPQEEYVGDGPYDAPWDY